MVIIYISLPIIGRELLTLFSVASYKPDAIHLFYPFGTKFHEVLKRAGHVAEGEASDQFKDDRSALIGWAHGPPDQIKCMCR